MTTQIALLGEQDKSNVERIEHYQSFEAGQYWKAKDDDDNGSYIKGQVLLIQLIDWVDNQAHTLHILMHPSVQNSSCSRAFRIRAEDFLSKFDFEPDAESIRRQELIEAQNQVTLLQDELVSTQSDPIKMKAAIQAEIGSQMPIQLPGTISLSLSDSFDLQNIETQISTINAHAENQIQVAKATANWIQSKTRDISSAIAKLTPYFQEAGAVALAKVSEVTKNVKKIQSGIESLDLYTGSNVEVVSIADGDGCSSDEPLSIHQLMLTMDEEICVFKDIDDDWDYRNRDQFFRALRDIPELLNTVLPEQRSVVMMSIRRKSKDYGNTFTNAALNKLNKDAFLLVRNGGKLWAVYSPIPSHLTGGVLFPKHNETDNVFKGIDGKNVNFKDLDYTEKLSIHEAMALHYKRFLILLCGLDHRLDLFGKFYPGSKTLDFISLEFQQKYIKFVPDAEFERILSPGTHLQSAYNYISDINSHIQAGARVLVYWSNIINKESSPGYYRLVNPGRPVKNYQEVIVQETQGQLYVNCELSKGRNVKVILAKKWLTRGNLHEDMGVIMLDLVDPDILYRYVHERQYRVAHTEYINLFKHALKLTSKQRLDEKPIMDFIIQAMSDAGMNVKQPKAIALLAMAKWRAMNKGAALPDLELGIKTPAMKSLLNIAFFEAGQGENIVADIKSAFSDLGAELLRVAMTSSGKIYAYLAPSKQEASQLPMSLWIKRVLVSIKKGKLIQGEPSWQVMKDTLTEKILFDSFATQEWLDKPYIEVAREQILDSQKFINDFWKGAELFNLDPKSSLHRDQVNALIGKYSKTRKEMSSGSVVNEPLIHLPFAIVMNESKQGFNSRDKAYAQALTITIHASSLLSFFTAKLGNEDNLNFAHLYSGIYNVKEKRFIEARNYLGKDTIETLNDYVFFVGAVSIKGLGEMVNGFYFGKGYSGSIGESRTKIFSLERNAESCMESMQVVAKANLRGLDQALKIVKVNESELVVFNSCSITDASEHTTQWLTLRASEADDDKVITLLRKRMNYRSSSYGSYRNGIAGLATKYINKQAALDALAEFAPEFVAFEFGEVLMFAKDADQAAVLEDVHKAWAQGVDVEL